jgi:hypothetical protein
MSTTAREAAGSAKPFLVTVSIPWEPDRTEVVDDKTFVHHYSFVMPVINLEQYLEGVTHGAN